MERETERQTGIRGKRGWRETGIGRWREINKERERERDRGNDTCILKLQTTPLYQLLRKD